MYGTRLITSFEGAILESMSNKMAERIINARYKKEEVSEISESFNDLSIDDEFEF